MYIYKVHILIILPILQILSKRIESPDDCYLIGLDGSLIYTGTINTTRNGTQCQRWDEDYPHTKIINMTSDNENYCRNPEGGELWCFSIDENIIWDYCDIKQCNTSQQLLQPTLDKVHNTGKIAAVVLIISLAVFIVLGLSISLFIKRPVKKETEKDFANRNIKLRHLNGNRRVQSDIFIINDRSTRHNSPDIQWNPSYSFTI